MKGVIDLEKQRPASASQDVEQASTAQGQSEDIQGVEENSVLPMQPGDLDICSTLLRCGAYYFSQASLVSTEDNLQSLLQNMVHASIDSKDNDLC